MSVLTLSDFTWCRLSYPGCDAWEALVLVDQQLELTPKFNLLISVWQDVLQGSQRRHVLNHQKTELVACLIEKLGLNFNL